MRLLPQRLSLRLAVAFALGAGAIAAFEWQQRSGDAAAAQRSAPTSADGAVAAAAVAVAPGAILPDPGLRAEVVVLAADVRTVPAADAVWQVLAGGRTVLRVPPPPPTAPGRRVLPTVAIGLPVGRLDRLDPGERAGLLDLLSGLFEGRPVPLERLQLAGVAGDDEDCAALLRWLR